MAAAFAGVLALRRQGLFLLATLGVAVYLWVRSTRSGGACNPRGWAVFFLSRSFFPTSRPSPAFLSCSPWKEFVLSESYAFQHAAIDPGLFLHADRIANERWITSHGSHPSRFGPHSIWQMQSLAQPQTGNNLFRSKFPHLRGPLINPYGSSRNRGGLLGTTRAKLPHSSPTHPRVAIYACLGGLSKQRLISGTGMLRSSTRFLEIPTFPHRRSPSASSWYPTRNTLKTRTVHPRSAGG
jgi:hypothetical protein